MILNTISHLLNNSTLYKHQIEFLDLFGIRGNYIDIVIVKLIRTECSSEMSQYHCQQHYPSDSPVLSDFDRISFKSYLLNSEFTQDEFEERLKIWFKDYVEKVPLNYLTSQEQSNHRNRIEFLYDFYKDIRDQSEISFTADYEYHEFDDSHTDDTRSTKSSHFQKYDTKEIIKWVRDLLSQHESEDTSDKVYDYDFIGMKNLIKTKMRETVDPKAYDKDGYKIMKKANTKRDSDICIGWTNDLDFVQNLNTFVESQGLNTIFVAQPLKEER